MLGFCVIVGWIIVFLAVVNSFFANGNSALIGTTRTWQAMGRIRLLPAQFERTHPRISPRCWASWCRAC